MKTMTIGLTWRIAVNDLMEAQACSEIEWKDWMKEYGATGCLKPQSDV